MNHKLTNKDISDHYRGGGYWFMRGDFLAAFAYWVVAQRPCHIADLAPAIRAWSEYVAEIIPEKLPAKFTYNELSAVITEDIFEGIPEIEKLNHSRLKNDFIDLGALARNVFYMMLRENITQL